MVKNIMLKYFQTEKKSSINKKHTKRNKSSYIFVLLRTKIGIPSF